MVFLMVFIVLGKSMVLLLITLNDSLSFAFLGKLLPVTHSFIPHILIECLTLRNFKYDIPDVI